MKLYKVESVDRIEVMKKALELSIELKEDLFICQPVYLPYVQPVPNLISSLGVKMISIEADGKDLQECFSDTFNLSVLDKVIPEHNLTIKSAMEAAEAFIAGKNIWHKETDFLKFIKR